MLKQLATFKKPLIKLSTMETITAVHARVQLATLAQLANAPGTTEHFGITLQLATLAQLTNAPGTTGHFGTIGRTGTTGHHRYNCNSLLTQLNTGTADH